MPLGADAIVGTEGRGGMRLLALGVAAAVWTMPALAQVVTVDGDTIRLAGTTWRLWGIDAPEMGQTCGDCARLRQALGLAGEEQGRSMMRPADKIRLGSPQR